MKDLNKCTLPALYLSDPTSQKTQQVHIKKSELPKRSCMPQQHPYFDNHKFTHHRTTTTPTLISQQSQSYSSPNPRAVAPHYITSQQHYIAKLQMLKILDLVFPFSTTSGISYSTHGWHPSLFSLSLHLTTPSIHLPLTFGDHAHVSRPKTSLLHSAHATQPKISLEGLAVVAHLSTLAPWPLCH